MRWKTKLLLYLGVVLLLASPIFACLTPTDDLTISSDTTFCGGTYHLTDASNNGLFWIDTSGVDVDLNGSTIILDSGATIFCWGTNSCNNNVGVLTDITITNGNLELSVINDFMIFEFGENVELAVKNVSFQGVGGNSYGMYYYNYVGGQNITVNNCSFDSQYSTLYSLSGVVTVINSVFTETIDAYSLFVAGPTVFIENVTINENPNSIYLSSITTQNALIKNFTITNVTTVTNGYSSILGYTTGNSFINISDSNFGTSMYFGGSTAYNTTFVIDNVNFTDINTYSDGTYTYGLRIGYSPEINFTNCEFHYNNLDYLFYQIYGMASAYCSLAKNVTISNAGLSSVNNDTIKYWQHPSYSCNVSYTFKNVTGIWPISFTNQGDYGLGAFVFREESTQVDILDDVNANITAYNSTGGILWSEDNVDPSSWFYTPINATYSNSTSTYAWYDYNPINFTAVKYDDAGSTGENSTIITAQTIVPITLSAGTPNNPPVFDENLTNQSIYHTQNLTYDINCSDTDLDPITYSDNTTLFDINSTSGLIFDNPTKDDVGNHPINITCDDGTDQTSQTFWYEILEPPMSFSIWAIGATYVILNLTG